MDELFCSSIRRLEHGCSVVCWEAKTWMFCSSTGRIKYACAICSYSKRVEHGVL